MDVAPCGGGYRNRLGFCFVRENSTGLDHLPAGVRGGLLLAVSQVGVALTFVVWASGGTPKESCCHRDLSFRSRRRESPSLRSEYEKDDILLRFLHHESEAP